MSDGFDLGAIRASLASAASSAEGVARTFGYVPRKLVMDDLPAVVIGNPDGITFNRTFGLGRATITIPVTAVVVEAGDPEVSGALLDAFASQQFASSGTSASLAAVLRRGQSDDDHPWTVSVKSAGEFGLYQFESVQYLGLQLVVEVTT